MTKQALLFELKLNADHDLKTAQSIISAILRGKTLDGYLISEKVETENGVSLLFFDGYIVKNLSTGKKIRHYLRKLMTAIFGHGDMKGVVEMPIHIHRSLSIMRGTRHGFNYIL